MQEYIYHESSGICNLAQHKLVQNRNKNRVCEVLYLLHIFCFYENNNLYCIPFLV